MKTFAPCGSRPNCVCTLNRKEERSYMEPLKVASNPISKLKIIFNNLNIEIKEETIDYLHGVATTKIMKFKDDVEFSYDEENSLLHFKSKSRVGRSDFGVNKKRIEKILKQL